ncbi:hypothetical protein PG991_001589 [Apiospora marii]|uniref:Uncharacterized protein n=1 Tax=Apiospora marii TaxID=335849 RepID=A0ABR1SQ43_9PEZI
MAPTAKICIGGAEYEVDTQKIPYLASFLKFQKHSGQADAAVPEHGGIPHFGIMNTGVEDGFRQFFRRMPTQLSEYHTLCETLEFLAIDTLGGRDMKKILKDLREGKEDYDPQERHTIPGNKSLARDSAFRLLYIFLLGEFASDALDSNMAYNATLFVVSHRAVFKYKTRKMVREAFEERFRASEKQQAGLDKWPLSRGSIDESQEDDATTEVEDYGDDFDSDWSS